jgi:hypothetical protein
MSLSFCTFIQRQLPGWTECIPQLLKALTVIGYADRPFKMKQTFLFFVAILITTFSVGQSNFDKTFVGTEKICWQKTKKDSCDNSDNFNPKWKWYRLNVLKIKGDSVFLDQSPISIYKKDTSYSASDGGFFYYHGKLTKLTDTTFSINLTEIFCDYCGTPVKKQADGSLKRIYRTKDYLCRLTKDGFWANEIFYKRTMTKDNLISEHPEPFLTHK